MAKSNNFERGFVRWIATKSRFCTTIGAAVPSQSAPRTGLARKMRNPSVSFSMVGARVVVWNR